MPDWDSEPCNCFNEKKLKLHISREIEDFMGILQAVCGQFLLGCRPSAPSVGAIGWPMRQQTCNAFISIFFPSHQVYLHQAPTLLVLFSCFVTIQSVVLTADVFQFLVKKKQLKIRGYTAATPPREMKKRLAFASIPKREGFSFSSLVDSYVCAGLTDNKT